MPPPNCQYNQCFRISLFTYESVSLSFVVVTVCCPLNVGEIDNRKVFLTSRGVNFINILHEIFQCKSVFRSFSLTTVWLCNFLAKQFHRTFYAHHFRQYFCTKILQSQNVTREKLCKALLYKKFAR